MAAVASAVLLTAIITGILLGTEPVPLTDALSALFSPDTADPFITVILCSLRLPRVVLAGICGALLAGAGAVFQGFFRNPLADSGLMGISSGAALGAVLSALLPAATVPAAVMGMTNSGTTGATILTAIMTGNGTSVLRVLIATHITEFCAFAGAGTAALLVYTASRLYGGTGAVTVILLTGTAASTFFSAVTSLVILLKDRELHKMFVWTLGSFNGKTAGDVLLVLPAAIISVILLLRCSPALDVLSGGEITARALGLEPRQVRRQVMTAGSIAAAAAVCTGGTIGFIGLITPHIVRKFCSPRHRQLIPLSMIWGAAFLIAADTIARTAAPPAEIPVGVITALAGAPFFISLLFAKERRYRNG